VGPAIAKRLTLVGVETKPMHKKTLQQISPLQQKPLAIEPSLHRKKGSDVRGLF